MVKKQKGKIMKLDMAQLKKDYDQSKGNRELQKWLFTFFTGGLGGLYLWATTIVIPDGAIGLRRTNRGKMTLLPPGRHSNFPWESYPRDPQSLSDNYITLNPFKIITVDTGYVAKSYNQGKLEILEEGQHLISDASHTVDPTLIPIKQETKKLKAVTASTRDNVGVTLHADVRYQIVDPEKAIRQIDDIENSIKEIAEIRISQIISHHDLSDFSPATTQLGTEEDKKGVGGLIAELTHILMSQLESLGIKLLNIGITSWSINDTALAHELAQGAVMKSKIQSQMLAAQNVAEVRKIEAGADSTVAQIKAQGDATSVLTKGHAFMQLGNELNSNQVAVNLYKKSLDIEMMSHAENVSFFFNQGSAGNGTIPIVATIPASPIQVP
jgi:regulator of protease activity HflC (stomatin/prohibitin superfamily)